MKLKIPSPAMVVALIALFVALSGTGYAAVTLKANSVGSREIKPRSVQTSDLATNARLNKKNRVFRAAVTDVVLDPGTQAAVDALAGAVKGEKGDKGDPGAAGAPSSVAGPAGRDGVPVVNVRTSSTSVSPSTTGVAVAQCADGENATGGGGTMEGDAGSPVTAGSTLSSAPTQDGNGWVVQMTNRGSETHSLVVVAVCTVVR